MRIGNKKIHSKTALSSASAPEDSGSHYCRLNRLRLFHSWPGRSWFHSWLEPLDTGLCLAGGIGLVFFEFISLDAVDLQN